MDRRFPPQCSYFLARGGRALSVADHSAGNERGAERPAAQLSGEAFLSCIRLPKHEHGEGFRPRRWQVAVLHL